MIVLGLGNPGAEYAQTRHNAGFLVVEATRRRWGGRGWVRRGEVEQTSVRVGREQHQLLRPLTYMNASGRVVEALLRTGVGPRDLLVVLDDIDLPLGRVRIRAEGGSGGHRGLQSILDALRPASVARLRVGVGRPEGESDAVEHVLGPLAEAEAQRFARVIDRCLEALETILARGLGEAMNRFNGRPAPWEEEAAAEARRAARGLRDAEEEGKEP